MSSITYQEKLNADRTEKIRSMLKNLPASCSDFISSIAMTTSVLTRIAYTIDLQTFCDYATKELPFFADKLPINWTDEVTNGLSNSTDLISTLLRSKVSVI